MLPKIYMAFLFLIVMPFLVNAQETTSEITGEITAGSTPLQGATISALHNPTGTKYVTTTRKDGRYNLGNLKVGGLIQYLLLTLVMIRHNRIV